MSSPIPDPSPTFETPIPASIPMRNMPYSPAENRYQIQHYRRCGRSGVKLPSISLGFWHNFGGIDSYENARNIARCAFDHGICHFDLANNYGPPFGSAEATLSRLLKDDFHSSRDELLISSKAGYQMWPGPFGEWGSRKSLIASCDQSLKRTGLDYFDIFYHHRPDPSTPLEETMLALDHIVRSGRALYVGISNYPAEKTRQAAEILKSLGTPCLIHQFRFNILSPAPKSDLLPTIQQLGIGGIAFSPLAQGLLSGKYLQGSIPDGSRASKSSSYLKPAQITPEVLHQLKNLDAIARSISIPLNHLAIAWVLHHPAISSCLIGASSPAQIRDAIAAAEVSLSPEILEEISLAILPHVN